LEHCSSSSCEIAFAKAAYREGQLLADLASSPSQNINDRKLEYSGRMIFILASDPAQPVAVRGD